MSRLAAVLLVAACGGGGAPAGQGGDRIAELRLSLAERPRDAGVHLALARALLAAGQPGGAVRHFEEARRRGDLGAGDSRALAALYRERARSRLMLGDGGAWRDAEAAIRLDRTAVARELLRESYFEGALAALRRADRPGRASAGRLLAAAARLGPERGAPGTWGTRLSDGRSLAGPHRGPPGRWGTTLSDRRSLGARDPRLAARAPAAADLADVGAAAAWLSDGGARRAALELYTGYVERGGRSPDHLRRYLVLHRWWYGDRQRPSALLLREMLAEGMNLCGVARSLQDLGCGEALARAAEHDPAAAEEVRRLAVVRGWRTADPQLAAAWAAVALRAWLDGAVGSWEAELAARVDLAALVESRLAQVPRHARATILRAAGRSAAAALEQAEEEAARLSPEARALLVAEATAQGREGAVDALLRFEPASPTAWRAALRAARGDLAREAALCEVAPPAVVRDHLLASGELGALAARSPSDASLHALARWRAALAIDARLVAGRDALETRWRRLARALPGRTPPALPLGVFDPHRMPLPDRGRSVTGGLSRVARAYLRDPALADRLAGEFADGAVALGSRGPLLVELFARLGDPARARTWAERVVASSPDHPAYLMMAGMTAAASGDSPRADVFFVRAAAASGDGGAASLLAARGFLAAARALPALTAARRAFDLTAPGEPQHTEAIDLAARALDQLGRDRDATALRRRLPAGALASPPEPPGSLPPPDAPGWGTEVAALLALGLIAPADRAAPALAAVADSLDRAGLHDLAEAARRERRALLGVPIPRLSR